MIEAYCDIQLNFLQSQNALYSLKGMQGVFMINKLYSEQFAMTCVLMSSVHSQNSTFQHQAFGAHYIEREKIFMYFYSLLGGVQL